MRNLFLWIGRLAAAGGAAVMVLAVGFRLAGRYYVGDLQIGTVLAVGVAGMVFSCVCLLLALTCRESG